MPLNEREKIIYITGVIRKTIELSILYDRKTLDEAVEAGRVTMTLLMKEFGLRPRHGLFEEIVKFEDEIEVISGILIKEQLQE